MKRLLYPHGFGDCIQAAPALSIHGGPFEVGVMSRLPACAESMRACGAVASTFGVEDPWAVGEPPDTMAGFRYAVLAMSRQYAAKAIWTQRPAESEDPRMAKVLRVCDELAVEWDGRAPSLAWDEAERAEGRLWALRQRREHRIALVHGSSGNPMKDVTRTALEDLARAALNGGGHVDCVEIPIPDKSVAWHVGALEAVDMFVGVDSGPAHLASTILSLPVVWVFQTTPVEQAIPLYERQAETVVTTVGPHREHLMRRWRAWRAVNQDVVRCDHRNLIGASV